MKRLIFLGISASMILLSCDKDDSEDEITPIVADFTTTVTGEAPNAQITFTNSSTGATSYSWTFGEGADVSTSANETPNVISVDKAGDLIIKLVVSNDAEEKELTKTVTIAGNNAIINYSDIEFALDAGNATYGRFFSFETGQIYKDTEIDETNGSLVDLAFGSFGNSAYFFESPTVEEYNIPNASLTKIVNFESSPSISVSEFDAMTDDTKLSGLTIVETSDSFGNSSIPGTVLFEISSGKKGVINTKAVNGDRLLVDIKIQKY